MKKLAAIVAAFVVLLAAAVLVVPGLIDWNAHKSEIARLVRDATGRELRIGGDIKASLIPGPRLSVEDVTFANVTGAAEPSLLEMAEVDVQIALGPLLTGNLQVESVILRQPVIHFEV
ncbi:MAG: AsmA family protein, partial [Rhodospirillales bacterium]